MFPPRAVVVSILAVIFLAGCANAPQASLEADPARFLGRGDATVTLVEYGDYQCEACFAFEPVVEDVIEQYKDRIKFVFRPFPLEKGHKNSLLASEAAEAAAEQGKFWEMHRLLYERQPAWSGLPSPLDTFVQYAKELGLDEAPFRSALVSGTYKQRVRASYAEGMRLGVSGTPTFFINGQKAKLSRSQASFAEALDAALGTASAPLNATPAPNSASTLP